MHDRNSQSVEIPTLVDDDKLIPLYTTTGAAGADVSAHLPELLIIPPGCSALVPTGVYLEIPEGYEIQVRPRSGLALAHQITVLNTPGTIDADYRGEIKVILINHGKKDFTITPGMRIAQLILAPVLRAHFLTSPHLSPTGRGKNGFGHTGLSELPNH